MDKVSNTLSITLAALTGLAALVDAARCRRRPSPLQGIAGPTALLGLIMFIRDELQPHIEGANDNATAVSILLGMAEALREHPLEHTEVTLLFTGCEEVACVGMENFLRQYAPPLQNTYWIDLEMVGTGNLCYVTRHGMSYLTEYIPSPGMVEIAAQTALAHPDLRVIGKDMLIMEEIANLSRRGYECICIAGYNAEGFLPNWHRLSDNLEHIEPETLGRAAAYTWAMMQQIDGL